jgi:hypothetical protein
MYSFVNDYEDISMDVNVTSNSSPIKQQKVKNSCAICEAKATGINFDVLTVSKNSF